MSKALTVGLIARKRGMTQVFSDDGNAVQVTVLEAGPCPVVQVKTKNSDGYEALQIGFEPHVDSRKSIARKLVVRASSVTVAGSGTASASAPGVWAVAGVQLKPETALARQIRLRTRTTPALG